MVDPVLTFASVALSTSVQGSRLLKALRGTGEDWNGVLESDHGRAYKNFVALKNDRAILQPGQVYRKYDKPNDRFPCISPFVTFFQDLYGTETAAESSTVYVLHDASGKGKSMGAIALLREFYQVNDTFLKGIMFSPKKQDGSYMEAIAQLLQASKVEGWLNLLLMVLNEELQKLPSLLVLDDFFFDAEGRNKNFISYIYNTLKSPGENRFNIIVVVITKERDVADQLCGMNGGERIKPMPGCYETKEDDMIFKMLRNMKIQDNTHPLTHPKWKPVIWNRDLLIEAVRYEYAPEVLAPISSFDFIEDGMTPLKACNLALKKVQAKQRGKAVSPRQGASQQFFPPDKEDA